MNCHNCKKELVHVLGRILPFFSCTNKKCNRYAVVVCIPKFYLENKLNNNLKENNYES